MEGKIMKPNKIEFTNNEGITLKARLELPANRKPGSFALFAHCFTCNKNLSAIRNISRALTSAGFGVMRFDFTGLGESEGDFADTNFSSNIQDLQAAAAYLEENHAAPSLLIGHSLGGAAVLYAAAKMDSVKAIATIAMSSGVGGAVFADLPIMKKLCKRC
jgi:alpha/beta superfamily hydrolase